MSSLVHLSLAVRRAAHVLEGLWRDVVTGNEQLPGVPEVRLSPYWQNLYVENIRMEGVEDISEVGHLRARVVCAHRIATDLEYGRSPWDMKPMLLGGKAHQQTRKGTRYTVIPFRHGVPGTETFRPMPADIYARAKDLEGSHTGAGPMRSFRESAVAGKGRGHGQLRGYRKGVAWGARLTGTEGAYQRRTHEIATNLQTGQGLARPIRYQHRTGIYEGMYRFPQKTARGDQSTYVTFRTVSDNSPPDSWFHPGWKPHGIAEGIVQALGPKIEASLQKAAQLDLVATADLSVGLRITGA